MLSIFLQACSQTPAKESQTPAPGPRNTAPKQRRITNLEDEFKPKLEQKQGAFVVSDAVVIRDTEANARIDLEDRIRRRALEYVVAELVNSDSFSVEARQSLERRVYGQPRLYIENIKPLREERLAGGQRIGMRARVVVDRVALTKALSDEGLINNRSARVIVILRKAAKSSAQVSPLAEAYVDDLAENLSRDLLERGFQPSLWKDVRQRLAERRDSNDVQLDEFLTSYVEESDWQRPSDERYELPLLLLRSQGRLLLGFRFLELRRDGLVMRATVRADAYDLLNSRSLGAFSDSAKETIGDRSLVEARQQLVERLTLQISAKLATSVQRTLRTTDRRRKDYKVSFQGYSPDELDRIESLLVGIVAEEIDSENDGETLTANLSIARAVIPVRDEIKRNLKRMGLECGAVKRKGKSMTFSKKSK